MEQKEEKITTYQRWCPYDVRSLCIANDWYTCGTNEDYNVMLDFVSKNEPTVENICWIAKDIISHSKSNMGLDIEAVMFDIGNRAVQTFYVVKEEGENI